MNAIRRLDPQTRNRILDLIGVVRYVRRTAPGSANSIEAPAPALARTPAQPAQAPNAPGARSTPAGVERASLLAELGLESRPPQLLLFVESSRAPTPCEQQLLEAIRRLLPPHRVLDVDDQPSVWPPEAIALGGRVQPPEGTRLYVAPPLSALRGNVPAKRALWRVIRKLRRNDTGR